MKSNMITLYVLLVLAASVLGYQDLEEVCLDSKCVPGNALKYSNVSVLRLIHGSDLEVVRLTPNLRILNVYNCSSNFKMDVFPSMAHLKEININNCHISELNKYQFENVINLTTLNLAGNSIERVSNETFHKLPNLRILNLQDNLIQVLPMGVFDTLKFLSLLDLSNNKICTLTKEVFLQNIMWQTIKLKGNPLKTVSLDFPMGYNQYGAVDLSDCGELRDLRLSALVYLYLNNSGVERLRISGSVTQIYHENSKVTHADLHGSEFWQSFEQVLCDMPSLEWLDLSRSSFYKFDENWTECTFPNLSFLNLSEINLKEIPRRLPFFGPNLTTLDLSRNFLDDESLEYLFDSDTFYQSEGNFPSLRFLNMSDNVIKYIPRRFPLFGSNLTTLDLSYNLLKFVSLESFAEAHSLQSLYLEGNLLTSFDYLAVCEGLKNLKHLALFDNLFDATFYDDMTKDFGDKDLILFQKEETKYKFKLPIPMISDVILQVSVVLLFIIVLTAVLCYDK